MPNQVRSRSISRACCPDRCQRCGKSRLCSGLVVGRSTLVLAVLVCGLLGTAGGRLVKETSCKTRMDGRLVDLSPLARTDGTPRFTVKDGPLSFHYNPCQSFNLPKEDPYSGIGDKCLFVMMCQTQNVSNDFSYYSLALEKSAKFMYLESSPLDSALDSDEEEDDVSDTTEEEDDDDDETPSDEEEDEDGDGEEEEEEEEVESEKGGEKFNDDDDDDDDDEENNDDDEDDAKGGDDSDDDKLVIAETTTVSPQNKTIAVKKQHRKNKRRRLKEKNSGRPKRYQPVPADLEPEPVKVQKINRVSGRLAIRFKGIKTYKDHRTYIILTCDPSLRKADSAQFTMLKSNKRATYYFELRHVCCCPGACEGIETPNTIAGKPLSPVLHSQNDSVLFLEVPEPEIPGPRHMWIIIVVNVGILALAIIIAAVCCRRGTSSAGEGTYYSYLPAIHGSQYTIHSTDGYNYNTTASTSKLSPDQLDYSSSLHVNSRLAMPDGILIPSKELEVGQRLGGGLYSDTYMTNWKKRPVAAKRITVGVHQNQLSEEDFQWVLKEISHLGKQRHKSLAMVLGLCNDGKQPYVVHEFLEGESLKDVLRKQDDTQFLSWKEKIKLLMQIADGMAYLHSAKRPVLHRDLRCANVMVNRSGKIKIVDHGMTRIVQRLRMSCNGRKGCYCRKESSAFPASIRWTAPEVLENPQADETSGIFSPACDVYSFAMVQWEMAVTGDPFEEIIDEGDVLEVVRSGGRPRMENFGGWIPQYRELMRTCWDQHPENRPNIKQVAVHLKTILHLTGSMKTQRPRTRNDSSTTSYLRSALNFPDV